MLKNIIKRIKESEGPLSFGVQLLPHGCGSKVVILQEYFGLSLSIN
jgi:hypothetical protein